MGTNSKPCPWNIISVQYVTGFPNHLRHIKLLILFKDRFTRWYHYMDLTNIQNTVMWCIKQQLQKNFMEMAPPSPMLLTAEGTSASEQPGVTQHQKIPVASVLGSTFYLVWPHTRSSQNGVEMYIEVSRSSTDDSLSSSPNVTRMSRFSIIEKTEKRHHAVCQQNQYGHVKDWAKAQRPSHTERRSWYPLYACVR